MLFADLNNMPQATPKSSPQPEQLFQVFGVEDIPQLEQRTGEKTALIEEMKLSGQDTDLHERLLELFKHGLATCAAALRSRKPGIESHRRRKRLTSFSHLAGRRSF